MTTIIKIVFLSFVFIANSYAAVYTNWRSGEPSDPDSFWSPSEDCAVIYASDGTWNDRGCAIFAPGLNGLKYSCYNGVSWAVTRDISDLNNGSAHSMCQELGNKFYFAVPFNAYENEQLRKAVEASGVSSAWLNAGDWISGEGNWVTNSSNVTAVAPPYITRWAGTDPNNINEPDGNDEDCGSMDYNGFWYDEPCSVGAAEEKRYLCVNHGTNWFISDAKGGDGRLYAAEKACRSDSSSDTNMADSTFGIPSSDAQNESIRNTIRGSGNGGLQSNEKIWINFNDRLVEGDYKLDENRYFWNVNEPNGNISGTEKCVVRTGSDINRGWNDTTCSASRSYACYRHSTNTWQAVSVAGSTEFNLEEGVKACQDYDNFSHQYTFWAPKDPNQNNGVPVNTWMNIQWDTPSSEWLINRDATHWGATVVNDKDGDGFNVNFRTIPEPNNGVLPSHAAASPALNVTDNEDCATQQADGRWFDLSCSFAMKYACYDAVNNDWRLAPASMNSTVYTGENLCQSLTKSHDYHFAAPGTRQQQADLALEAGQVSVWVNGTDRTEEKSWRYNQFLTFWAGEGVDAIANPEQPEKDELKDCAVASGADSALWYARSCTENHQYLCLNSGSWSMVAANTIDGPGQQSGQEACSAAGGLFLAPNTLAEQQAVSALIGANDVWINASDVQIEGTWKVNELQFWDAGQPASSGDCAIMKNSNDLWETNECTTQTHKYLCFDTEYGSWAESGDSGTMEHFSNGQTACEKMNGFIDGDYHEFIFAAPIYTWENDAANNAISENVWINGNDRIVDDLWVFNEFLYWSGSALNSSTVDANDCLTMNASGHWQDTSCESGSYQVACYSGDGWYLSPTSINVSNFSDAQRACNEIGDGYRFFSPVTVADNRDLRELVGGTPIWINGIDIAEEGKWVFNSNGLPTPNWASTEPHGKTVENCAFVASNGLWYDDECSGVGSDARKLVCIKSDDTLGISANAIELVSNFDAAHAECIDTFGANATFYAPTTFNENEELRQTLSSGDEVWVNASDSYIESRWALNISVLANYGSISPNTASIDGCAYFDNQGSVVASSCMGEARAVVCGNGYEWKVTNDKVLLGTAADNGALIRNAFAACQAEFSGDYTFVVPSDADLQAKWELTQALALSGKTAAWLNMADWFVADQFSSNMPYQNVASNPVQVNTGCAYSDGSADGWLIAEQCDSMAAHFACYNGSVWKVAPANGTIDEPSKPQLIVDAWDQSYGDLRCREFYGQSYNFSAPITPKEDANLKQVINRLEYTHKQTWINYYSNRLWSGLNGQQWFADRVNLNVVDGIQLDQGATTEDCGSFTKKDGKLILKDEVCSLAKQALCFEGSAWSKTTTPTQWNKASAQCGLEFGEQHVFAIPRDSLERSQVDALLSEDETLWVSFSDLSIENKWRANIPVRQWWADDEPTNRGNRDCVVMGGVGSGMTPGEWRSDYCDQVFHQYACKRGTAWQVIGLDGTASSAGGIWAQGFSACRKIPFVDAADEAKGPWHFDFPEDYFANLATATTIAAGTGDTKDFDNGDAELTTALVNTTAWLNLTDQYREKDWQRGRQFSAWAADFAFDDNKDCAFVDTVTEQLNGQSVQGTWQPGLCFASETPRQYACTNGLNWAVTPTSGNNWLDGFAACDALEPAGDWTFAAPVTSFDNERLKAAIGKGTAWINLQDVSSDGDWAANLSAPNLPPIIKFATENSVGNINEASVAEQSVGNNINLQVIDPEGSAALSVEIEISADATITSAPLQTAACNLTCDFSFTYSAAAATNTIKSLSFKLIATDDAGLTTTTYFKSEVVPAIIAWYDFNNENKPNYDKTGNGNDANDSPELPYDFPPVKNGAIDISSGSEKMTVDGTKLAMPANYAVALRIWADGEDDAEYQSFQIKFDGTQQCFDLPGTGATAAQVGNNVAMYACEDQSDQYWYRDEETGLIHSVANDAVCLAHPSGTASGSNIELSYCANVQHPWIMNSNGSIESSLVPGSFLYAAAASNNTNVVLSTNSRAWVTDKNFGRGILQKGPAANQPLLTFGDKTSYLTYTVGEDSGTTDQPLKEEQWVNVVVNVVGTELTLFVDGIKETPVTLTTAAVANSDDLVIGDIPSALRSFIGRIDDVQVFSRPLTDSEVIEILPEPPVGLVQFESASIVRQEPQVEGASLTNPVIVRRTDGSNGQLRAWYKTHEKSANDVDDYLKLNGNEALNELVWKETDQPLYLTPEYDLLPLLSSVDNENIDSVELDRTAPIFIAIDLSIPADPVGILWEQGGSGRGSMVAFNAAHELVVRAGNGQVANAETARFVKNKAYVDATLVGKTGTLFVSIDPSQSVHSIKAWFKEGGLFGELPIVEIGEHTSSSPFPSNEWQGGDAGMLGNINSGLVLGEFSSNTPFQARYIRNTISGSDINGGVHWVEIQAFDAVGTTNLAQGITNITSSNTFVRSKDFITNGNLDSNEYAEVNGTEYTPRWVQIDLGSEQTLSSINVRHYSVDTRMYSDNKTEYSVNGTDWTTIADFTSAPYVETSAGKSMDVGVNSAGYDYNGTITMGRFYNQTAPQPIERIVENAKLAKVTLLNENPFDREPTERFDLELINTERRAADANSWVSFPEGTTGYLNQTEVSLLDYTKNPQGIMQFSHSNYECSEPYADDNNGTADYAGETRYYRDCSVEVQRRTGDQDNISVEYGISANGMSYTFAEGSVNALTDVLFSSSDLKLTFAPGVRTQSINFRVIAEIGSNNRFENDEKFTINLFNPYNIDDGNPPWLGDPIEATVVSKDYAVGTVNMPRSQVTLTEPLFGEADSHIQTVDVRRSGGGDGIAIVDVSLAEVSIDNADYDLVDVNGDEIVSPVRLTWLDGQQSSQPIFIKVYSDRFQEFTSVVQTTDAAADCYDDPADSDNLPDDLNRDCVNGDSLTLTLTTVSGSKAPVDSANDTTTVYIRDNTAPAVIKFTADTLAFTTVSEGVTADTVDVNGNGTFEEGTDTVADRRIQPKIERSNSFAEHAVWLYIRGVEKAPAIAADFVGVNSSKPVGDRIYRGRDQHDAWIQTPYVRDGGFANEYRHLWVMPMAAENNIAPDATVTTSVTGWNSGNTSSNLSAITDGSIGTGFQVHPTDAKGKNINFSWPGSYQGGRVVYYNRTDCCRTRVSDARIDFYLAGGVVYQFEFSSVNTDVNEISISIPENIEFDQMRLEFSSAGDNNQNFREIEVFSRSTSAVSDVHSIDVVLYDNDRTDAQNRNIEFRIEAASERDDRVIELGSAGSNSTAEFTDIEITDENLPPEFNSTSQVTFNWPLSYGNGSGMIFTDKGSRTLAGVQALDRDWLNVAYRAVAVDGTTNTVNQLRPDYNLQDYISTDPLWTGSEISATRNGTSNKGSWSAFPTKSRVVTVTSTENGTDGNTLSVTKDITVNFSLQWRRITLANSNNSECMFSTSSGADWGYGTADDCDTSDRMYWAAIPQGTTPESYQLINKNTRQCLYSENGNSDVRQGDCVENDSHYQWTFNNGSKRIMNVYGNRPLCGYGYLFEADGVRVHSNCDDGGDWEDFRWRP